MPTCTAIDRLRDYCIGKTDIPHNGRAAISALLDLVEALESASKTYRGAIHFMAMSDESYIEVSQAGKDVEAARAKLERACPLPSTTTKAEQA